MNKNSLVSSFSFAFLGIWQAIKKERNIKIHLLAAFLVVLAGIYFQISKSEWLALVLIISAVLAAEIFNSAIEEISNLLTDKLSLDRLATKSVRDVSAGAVFVLAIASVILGLIIFLPYLF